MDTVHLSCGHCGNLMAVDASMLGQQVRCPHCQQVVQTPAPAPVANAAPPAPITGGTPPEPEPAPVIFPSHEEESIFTPPVQDDLFGDPKPPATVEMPPETGWSAQPAAAAPAPAFHESPRPPMPEATNGPAYAPPTPDPLAFNVPTPVPDPADRTEVLPPVQEWSKPAGPESRPSAAQESAPAKERTSNRRAPAPASTTATILIFLVPYAVFMTAVAGYFWHQSRQIIYPLEQLPDEGEHRGVQQGDKKISRIQDRWKVDSELPAKLHTKLGKPLRVGALEVTPLGVARTPVTFCYDPPKQRPEQGRVALVLTLKVKNVSSDQQFCPTDPYFDARVGDGKPKPYTFLEMGSHRFFGGPIPSTGTKPKVREYVQGQEKDPQPLGPGEERTTVICTNPEDPTVMRALESYKGPLVWRVRVRQGVVMVRDKPRSATAVIGVDFTKADIH